MSRATEPPAPGPPAPGLPAVAPPPAVAIVVPVHNGARFLGEALASIAAQRYAPLEVVVVDDGSDDGPDTVVARAAVPVRLIRQSHQGVSAARNAGVAATAAGLIGFLDADDRYAPGAVRALVGHACADPAADIVHARLQRFTTVGAGDAAREVFRRPELSFNASSLLWRRGAFARTGGFDPRLALHEDTELLIRAQALGLRRVAVPDVVLHYRRGHGSTTERAAVPAAAGPGRAWFRILHNGLAHRRRAGLLPP